jgi:hypothetical protein
VNLCNIQESGLSADGAGSLQESGIPSRIAGRFASGARPRESSPFRPFFAFANPLASGVLACRMFARSTHRIGTGEMAEWLKALVC